MSRNRGYQSANSSGKSGLLVVGILVGMLLGLAAAGGVAWYMQQRPSPYQAKSAPPAEAAPNAEVTRPAARPAEPQKPVAAKPPTQPHAASGTPDAKPRFEFYKVLTDKPETTPYKPATQGASHPQIAKPAPDVSTTHAPQKNEAYFLQAGSFSNAVDADKLKAKLALLGMEASVQTVTLPERGVWHRVRLGPYRTAEEMNQARIALKQNGVISTSARAQ